MREGALEVCMFEFLEGLEVFDEVAVFDCREGACGRESERARRRQRTSASETTSESEGESESGAREIESEGKSESESKSRADSQAASMYASSCSSI